MPAPKDPIKRALWIEKLQNKIVTQESRDAMSKAKKEIPLSEKHKKNISIANTGRIKSEKECENISKGLKNKPKSDIHRKHLSESLMGNIPWNVGISPSKETRDKISNSKLGQHQSEETIQKRSKSMIGNTNTLGFKHSKETCDKMRDSAHKGESHPNWKGGITPLIKKIRRLSEYDIWVESVFKRDIFTCQKCNHRGGDLNAHHIKEFSKLVKTNNIKTIEDALLCEELWDINNGTTLCVKCHKEEHLGDV